MTQASTRDRSSTSDDAKHPDKRNHSAEAHGGGVAGAIDTVADKAKEFASNAGDIVDHAREKVQEWAHAAQDKVKEAAAATGEMAGHVRDKSQQLASTAVQGAGEAISTVGEAITHAIRKYPMQSMLLGAALGYLLVKVTSRS